jgi:hypothetical protein
VLAIVLGHAKVYQFFQVTLLEVPITQAVMITGFEPRIEPVHVTCPFHARIAGGLLTIHATAAFAELADASAVARLAGWKHRSNRPCASRGLQQPVHSQPT